jgi:hypothetical protein
MGSTRGRWPCRKFLAQNPIALAVAQNARPQDSRRQFQSAARRRSQDRVPIDARRRSLKNGPFRGSSRRRCRRDARDFWPQEKSTNFRSRPRHVADGTPGLETSDGLIGHGASPQVRRRGHARMLSGRRRRPPPSLAGPSERVEGGMAMGGGRQKRCGAPSPSRRRGCREGRRCGAVPRRAPSPRHRRARRPSARRARQRPSAARRGRGEDIARRWPDAPSRTRRGEKSREKPAVASRRKPITWKTTRSCGRQYSVHELFHGDSFNLRILLNRQNIKPAQYFIGIDESGAKRSLKANSNGYLRQKSRGIHEFLSTDLNVALHRERSRTCIARQRAAVRPSAFGREQPNRLGQRAGSGSLRLERDHA